MSFLTKLFGRSAASPAVVEKTITEAAWGPSAAAGATGNVSIAGRSAQSNSLRPTDLYEVSIAVHRAVTVIADNICSARVRFFTRAGREIEGGEMVDLLRQPVPGMGQSEWLRELVSWYNIYGEIAARVLVGSAGRPVGLYPLDPSRLRLPAGHGWRYRSEVKQWEYHWETGKDPDKISPANLLFARMFNPSDGIRGLSPLLAGTVTASTAYYIERYNKSYFENNAIPSHILSLPDATGREQRKEFESRWADAFSTFGGNAHKFLVVSGTQAKVEKLEGGMSEGAFMDLLKYDDEKIATLYGVPGLEMGLGKPLTGDAEGDRELFAENTLMPQMNAISQMLQIQLVDRYFPTAPAGRPTSPLKGRLGECFEKALGDRPASSVIALLDPDTLPIMTKVQLSRAKHIKALREDCMMSPQEAAKFAGMDEPEHSDPKNRELRQHIWIPAKTINVTKPEMNPQWGQDPKGGEPREGRQEVKPGSVGAGKPKPKAGPKKPKAQAKKEYQQLRGYYVDLRSKALGMADRGEHPSLEDMRAIAGDRGVASDALSWRISNDYLNFRKVFRNEPDAEARKALIKSYLNGRMSRASLKSLL